jgi:hypothetical protein
MNLRLQPCALRKAGSPDLDKKIVDKYYRFPKYRAFGGDK